MNLKPANRILRTIKGDISELPLAPAWCQLKLGPDEEVRISQGDMASAFYLFEMPRCWRPFFGFQAPFKATEVGSSLSGTVVPVCRVLPMGWTSSVGLMQMLSRQLLHSSQIPGVELRKGALTPPWFVEDALRKGGEFWWQVYLDNFMSAEIKSASSQSRSSEEVHSLAMNAWDEQGVLSVPEKHVIGTSEGVELGVRIGGGAQKFIGASSNRLRKLVLVTLELLKKTCPKRRWVQVILGRWIFVLQFRRPGMTVLNLAWNYLKPEQDKRRWWPSVQKELAVLVMLAPILQSDTLCSFSPIVTCSDASESGGAVAVAKELSLEGKDFCGRLRNLSSAPVAIPVLVLSLFNGIGGSFRSYDVSGLAPVVLISVECDQAARRVTRRAWPQVIEIDDVRKIDRQMVEDWSNSYPRIKEVHTIAGFPCVHLSSARAGRQNLEGEGSNLFWELLRVLKLVEDVFEPKVKTEFVVENVASMDIEARDEISAWLGVEPILVCPSDLMPFNRPRLAWVSVVLQDCADVTLEQGKGFVRIWMHGEQLDDPSWLDEGWSRCDIGCKLPTFMKSIKRWKPPPKPAGIQRCEPSALDRWSSDEFRFPPYQYRRQFLLHNRAGDLRYPSVEERTRLLGFGRNHVAFAWSAGKVKDDPRGFVDKQLCLLGDSFAILSFGWIVSQVCKKWQQPLTPTLVLRRLGLAPGAGLNASFAATIGHHLKYGSQNQSNSSLAALVAQLSRHVNHTGSDVSLALAAPFNPRGGAHVSVQAGWWDWRIVFTTRWWLKSHINALEMKMILQAIEWRSRSVSSLNTRWLHLADSMVSNYILSKGRTSSLLLQPIVGKINAILLALNSVQLQAHVDSGENPTDAASRQ